MLEETGDSIIGGFFIGVLFVAVTSLLYTWIASNTTILSNTTLTTIIRQILIGTLFVLGLSILANYQVLRTIKNHAFVLLKTAFFIQIALLVLGLVGIGFVIGGTAGLIIAGIGGVVALLMIWIWPRVRKRLELAAEWLTIAAEIVLAEPGMIFLSIVQSIIVGITIITEVITVYAFNVYANNAALNSNLAGYIQYIIGFVYLVFSLFILYFFDGANTIMAYARIKGVDPTIGQGLNGATKKVLSILGFAFITAVVKTVAQALRSFARDMNSGSNRSSQAQIAAMVFSFMIGIAEWIYHLISFFTLPIIVLRQKNTVEAMKESKNLFARNAWNVIFSDMGYSLGAMIMYFLTGIILAFGGYFYGLSIATVSGSASPVTFGIIVAIIALIFGLSITKFFLRPLYTSFVTTIYVYASEGPSGLKIVSKKLVNQIDQSLKSPKAQPRRSRRF